MWVTARNSRAPPVLPLFVPSMSLGLCSTLPYPFCISKSFQVVRTSSATPLSWTTRSHNVDHHASSKLFADAEHEERGGAAPTRTGIHPGTTLKHPSWTGDERVEDAVLRMLVDKYKPLRTRAIQTAEENMHRALPRVSAQQPETFPVSMSEGSSSIPSSFRSHIHRAEGPLLPAVEGHKPWLTTFKVPSHATASIRYGQYPGSPSSSTSSTRRSAQSSPVDDDRMRRKEREVKKRSEIVGRLSRAKESTLDYRLGITKNVKGGVQARPNPVSIKGWAGLIEERIEVRCILASLLKPTPFPHPPSGHDKKNTSIPSSPAGITLKGATNSKTPYRLL